MNKRNQFFGAIAMLSVLVLPQGFVLAAKKISHHVTKTATTTSVTTLPVVISPVPVSVSSNVGWTSKIIYDGYGTVVANDFLRQVSMTPKAATQPSETHAALVISQETVHQPFQLSYTMKTTSQLRTGSTPNAWEVGWLVFGYKPTGAFKYLVLKPNGYGVELGESLLNNDQNFLYTSAFNQDMFPVNTDYNVNILVRNNVVTVMVNGKKYLQYTMSLKDVLSADGQYGFYTEDASVQVSNIKMQQL